MPLKLLASLALSLAAFWAVLSPSSAPSLSRASAPPTPDELWPGSDVWADAVLDTLTLEEKVGQLFVTSASAARLTGGEALDLLSTVRRGAVGGVVFTSGAASDQARAIRQLQLNAPLPLLVSQEVESGLGARLSGATQFPSAMAVGAAQSPELAYLQGRAIAREARSIGVHVAYAPVGDVAPDVPDPALDTRSFGSDAGAVGALATSMLRGLQDGGVVATLRHLPTDPLAPTDRQLVGLETAGDVELAPFRQAVDAGVMSVMTGPPGPDDAQPWTGRLRNDLRFSGLVVADASSGDARSTRDAGEQAVRAIEAGADQLLLSTDVDASSKAVLRAVASGRLSEARIDASARRVLRAKAWAGLEEMPAGELDALGTPQERRAARLAPLVAPPPALLARSGALADHIARRSTTVLQDRDGLLPFAGPDAPARILTLVLDDGLDAATGRPLVDAIAERIPEGGAALSQRLSLGDPESIYDTALRLVDDADVTVLATFRRARPGPDGLALPPRHAELARRVVAQGRAVVVATFGTPHVAQDVGGVDAVVAAYGDGRAEQHAVADALFGRSAFTGRLPVALTGYGDADDGLQLAQQTPRPGSGLDAGLNPNVGERVDAVLRRAISDRAFPGAGVAIGRAGVLLRLRGYGSLSYSGASPATAETPYDLASLTKVVGTTLAVMQLVEEGRLDLDGLARDYLPRFRPEGDTGITIRQLLSHTAGQRPWYPFYAHGLLDERSILDKVYSDTLIYRPGARSRYSDYDMIVLGEVIEAVTGESLDRYLERAIYRPLGMRSTGFRRAGAVDRFAAPTEVDRVWRNRVLQGEVHDEAASALGGVAGHAGLFSTADDLATFGFMLANRGRAERTRMFSIRTLDTFTERVRLRSTYPTGLGWMVRAPGRSYSSSGSHFGPRSFGHTGFTGTSIWVDPDQELFVVLLTNRVHPTRNNSRIKDVRSDLADAVASSVEAPIEAPWRSLGFGPAPDDLPALEPLVQP